jgi:hypothetical protein
MKWKDERRSRNGGDNEMRVEPSKHELANLTSSFFVSSAARLPERWRSLTATPIRGREGHLVVA